jgi:hypothetical protein
MAKDLKSAASILTKYRFKMVDSEHALTEPATITGPGVFVIAKEQQVNGQTVFSVVDVYESDSMKEPLIGRLQYWRDQGVVPLAFVAPLSDKGLRIAAAQEVSEICKTGTQRDDD